MKTEDMDTGRLSLYVSPDYKRLVRIRAAEAGVTMREATEHALRTVYGNPEDLPVQVPIPAAETSGS